MPNYITHGLVHKKGLGKQRVGKQAVKVLRAKNRFENGAHWRLSPVGCVNLGHVALRHMLHFKTKASSAPVPGLLKYSNEIAVDLLTGAGLL